ncbi:MAG: hypothetical protein WB819_06460, partial [Terriglobia bacterium]
VEQGSHTPIRTNIPGSEKASRRLRQIPPCNRRCGRQIIVGFLKGGVWKDMGIAGMARDNSAPVWGFSFPWNAHRRVVKESLQGLAKAIRWTACADVSLWR